MKRRDRELDFLLALLFQVRWLSAAAAAGAWALGPSHLRRLEREGWVAPYRVTTWPIPAMGKPLLVWEPGDPPLDADHWAYVGQTRATGGQVEHTVYCSSARARRVYGGYTRPRVGAELWHDLLVGAVLAGTVSNQPELAHRLIGEDRRKRDQRPREPLVDLMLVSEQGEHLCSHEILGRYSAERILKFANYHETEQLPFAFW